MTHMLSDAIFVAVEPPVVKMRNGHSFSGKQITDYVAFSVKIDQIKTLNQRIWSELLHAEKDVCKVMIIHADEFGNMSGITLEYALAFQPDLVFCCYSAEASRVHPDLPIQGRSLGVTTATFSPESCVVKLKFG